MNKMKRVFNIKTAFITLFVVFSLQLFAQIPEAPNPPQLVNDFAGLYTPEQRAQLEKFLVMVDDSTSNQICVVTVKDFGGMDKAEYATQLGIKWGIGGKKFNNGIVLLIKPKVGNQRGEAFIAVGYGLEGALPDASCRRIIDEAAIPYFKQNDYFSGTSATVTYLYKIAKGEIKAPREKKNNNRHLIFIALIIVVFIVVVASKKKGNNNNDNNDGSGHTSYGSAFPWLFLGGGGFGGGGSSSGDDGGGFGGFGGGDFGGGGAGGSW
jgi:uncharacterized protein